MLPTETEKFENATALLRLIAFYLPQFHPVPENDKWWGKGFTEWANVAKASSRFPGHYQPHLPADLGFYDLRLPEARQAQADLARQYGIHGFCYYHYWFNGRRILERPFSEVLASGTPGLPFCLCWANENWTRRWDGQDQEILLQQRYSFEDDLKHIRSLLPAFEDERYIRVNGKPLFLVYRTEHLPDPARTAEIWREEALRSGIGDLYLVRVENLESIDPGRIGFDAAVEFAPNWRSLGPHVYAGRRNRLLRRLGRIPQYVFDNSVFDYDALVHNMLQREYAYRCFRGVTPSWDNSARRQKGAAILQNSSPAKYAAWLQETVKKTEANNPPGERLIFINAWNEWAEGCHLEPDMKYGHAYLEATRAALLREQTILESVKA